MSRNSDPIYPEECLTNYRSIFKDDILSGKVAFITGGGSGICFTIAEIFMRHGCDTIIASRSLQRVQQASATLSRATGRRCIALSMDVRKPDQILQVVDEALSQLGKIDYLINGAAGNFLCPLENMSFNAFRTVMEIDAQGTFNVSKAVYDKYFKNHGGVIINITAMLHQRGIGLQGHVGPAKAAIEALSRHMAVEWGLNGVRVMCVAPGPIEDTEGFRKLGGGLISEDYIKAIPVQRVGTRADIGHVCLFLVTSAAELLTGTTVVADGGSSFTDDNNYYQKHEAIKSGLTFRKPASKL